MPGTFLSMEGMDGAGKSTQIQLLEQWLTHEGYHVVRTFDPGGTPFSAKIRELLLSPSSVMGMRTEMLLYLAARSDLVDEVIQPALDAGHIVLSDRYLLSTIVYQGYAGGQDIDAIRAMGTDAAAGVLPNWIGVLDLPVEESLRRRTGETDRIEQRPADYHARVRAGYQAEAERDPTRIHFFDATQSVEALHRAIREDVARALEK